VLSASVSIVGVHPLTQLDVNGQSRTRVLLTELQELAIARGAVQEMLPAGIVQAGRSMRQLGQDEPREAASPGRIRVRVAKDVIDLPLKPGVVVVGRLFSLCHRQFQDRLPEQANDRDSQSVLPPMNVAFDWMIPRRELV
jgi:hypothetical protein